MKNKVELNSHFILFYFILVKFFTHKMFHVHLLLLNNLKNGTTREYIFTNKHLYDQNLKTSKFEGRFIKVKIS